jgi:malonate transporter MadL subunit
MKIYGVAILAACFLSGQLIGDGLAGWIGLDGNIGGVGFSMLMLILFGDWMKRKGMMPAETEKGVQFWSAMYIPVVVAMSSIQNVRAALTGGWVALLAGVFGTAACLLLVPVVSSIGKGRRKVAEPIKSN